MNQNHSLNSLTKNLVAESSRLKEKFMQLEKKLQSFELTISELKKRGVKFPDQHIVHEDKICRCKKCGSRLGIYDEAEGDLRIRYRDFFAYWKGAQGGYLKIVCRGCSFLNELRYND